VPTTPDASAAGSTYSEWVAYANGTTSYSQPPTTHYVLFNLLATTATGDKAGTFTGQATESATTGAPAGAKAKGYTSATSSALSFTITSNSSGAFTGSGTISMDADTSGHSAVKSGPFASPSTQKLEIKGSGTKAVFSVEIGGRVYRFKGTIIGQK
jgi:hypothetical protein